jgi:HPt (histidine-containing phosphotransfer) domain-containing protein
MSDITGIDPQGLARLNKMGGADFVCKMIDLFLGEAPERLNAARNGEKAGDLDAVAGAAHSLKSSAQNFGANGLARLAEKIEIQAHSKNCENLGDLLRDLEQAFAAVKVWLEGQRDLFKK